MSDLYPTKKHNPCPVCDSGDGDCRHSKVDENFIQCHTFVDARKGEKNNGYVCVKESNGHTASFKLDNSAEWTEEQQQQWADEQRQRREHSEQQRKQKLAQLLPVADRDKQYRRIVGILGLNQKHRISELSEKRGLNTEEIDFAVSQGWIASWKPGVKVGASPSLAGIDGDQLKGVFGLAIAYLNNSGQVTGFQIASDNRVKYGKYPWLSSASKGGNSPHLTSGELPIAVWRHPEAEKITETWLIEGGLKSLITTLKLWFRYGRKDIQIIGASGANWTGSINAVVEGLGQNNKVVLCPDAGSLSNGGILSNYKKITEELASRTYSVSVAWWNQLEKGKDPDIDELDNTLGFDLITPEEFFSLSKVELKPELKTEITKEYKETDYERKVAREQKRLNTLTIKEEWEVLKSEGRFLDEKLLEKIPYSGIALLPLPIGIGKSTFIKKILKKYPDRKVISITPTIALGRGQAEIWGLTWREEAEAQGVSNGLMLSNTQKLGLCYPSLHKLSGIEGDEKFSNIDNKKLILILDEAEEGLSFLMQSSMANQQGKRPYNIAALKDLLKNAKEQEILVIVADANLKNPAVDYLTKLLPELPVTVITSNYKPERGTATYYDTPLSVFEHALKEAVENGQRVIIPCDSQEHGEALDKKFTAMGCKVIRCDRTTASGDDMKAFIANPDKFLADVQPQIVIYSPTLGSGTSIQASQEYADNFQQIKQLQIEEITLEITENLKKISENWENLTPYFDQKFAYNYHLIPPQFRQMIGRYRYPIPTSYWCGKDLPITGCKSPLPGEQLRQAVAHSEGVMDIWELAKKEAGTDDSIDIVKAMDRIITEANDGKNQELTLWAEQRARECFFQVKRAEKLIDELKNDGYIVKSISEELEEGEKLEDSEFGEEVKEIKEETRKELSLAVVTAPIIPEEDYKFLDKKPSLSPEERVYVDRYRFEQQLPGLLDELSDNGDKSDKAAKFYYHAVKKDRFHWINALRLFWGYSKQDDLKENDLTTFDFSTQRFEKSGIAALQDNLKIKAGFFKFVKECGLLEAKDGVDLNDLNKEYTAESFKKLLHNFGGKYKAKLKTYFDAIPLKDDSRAIPWINKRLIKFALKLTLSREDFSKVRYYKITPEIPNWADENIQNKIFAILDAKIASNVDTASVLTAAVTSGDCIHPPVVTAADFERTTSAENLSLVVHLHDPIDDSKAAIFVSQSQEILMATCSPMLIAIARQIKETGSAAIRALEGLDVIELLAIDEIIAELSGA